MRHHTAALPAVLTGSFGTRLIVDAFYGSDRTRADLGVAGWELTWNSEADIKSAGSLTVVYTDELAQSLSPTEFTDVLAPFGQELNLAIQIIGDDSSVETLQLGRYRITDVPDARDEHFQHLGQTFTIGSRITLTLEDRMVLLARWGFRSEQAPAALGSCWDEIQRISGMQVVRTVPDKTIPPGIIYKAVEGGRLNAVQELAKVLDGVPYITPEGALAVLSNGWGDPVGNLVLGEAGTIIAVEHSMTSDGVYNEVIGNFETEDRTPIFATAEVRDGRLATSGSYWRYTKYVTSDKVHTQIQADAYVAGILAEVTSRRVYRVPVQCILDPRVEDGDVMTIERPTGGLLTGRVVSHKFGAGRSMSLEMDVIRNA